MTREVEPAGRRGPASLVLVTGHTFGRRAFEGIFSSPAFLDGRVEARLMIGLDDARAAATVGYQPLAGLAAEQGVRYLGTSDGRLTSLAGEIRAAEPAYLLVIGWSALIPPEILAVPSPAAGPGATNPAGGAFGCIGMHPTRLPHGRGQAPIPWTIIKGETRTALSVFFLETGADTGPLIAQYGLAVHPRETAASLFYRIGHLHFTAGHDLAEAMGRRCVPSRPQDPALATRWPRRRPADGEILSTMSRREIDALVRALRGPYPSAFVRTGAGGQVPIRAVLADDEAVRPAAGGLIRFRCRDGEALLVPE